MTLKDQSIYALLVTACSQTQLMALPTKLGPLKASFAVDMGAVVNVLSEEAYRLIKFTSQGSRWPLRPNDLNIIGVSSEPLNILGVVYIPIFLGKGTSRLCLDFYVVSDFSLPSDGLLGLTSLKSNRIVIHPDTMSLGGCHSG